MLNKNFVAGFLGVYKKGKEAITIFGVAEVSQIRAKFEEQQTIINSLHMENMQLKQRLRRTEENLEELKAYFDEGLGELYDFMDRFLRITYQTIPDLEERGEKLKEIFTGLQRKSKERQRKS